MREEDSSRFADVGAVVAARLPGYRVRSVALLGEGQDNTAYEVNGELIVRFAKEADPVSIDHEARLLAAVAEISPLPVPKPLFVAAELGCVAYSRLPGLPLIDLPASERPVRGGSVATVLGRFLDALHRVPLGVVDGLVPVDDQPKDAWLREAAETYEAIADHVPKAHRPAVAAFLEEAAPSGGNLLVFSHNDLGIEHVLVDPATREVTGVIDWSDAAITDPAYDFGLLYRDLGPGFLDSALLAYRPTADGTEELRTRSVFYARCAVLEDLAYGLEPGHDEYLVKSLDAFRWLYP